MDSRKKTARLAGLLYFLLSVQAPISLLYVPTHILVKDNPAATINNIISHEFLFRLSIISQLTSAIIFLYLAFVLYRLFKPLNEYRAGILVAFVVAQVVMTFIFETFNFTSLMIAKGEILRLTQPEQTQALAMLLLKIHSFGLTIQEIFWGLWLLPFGQLVYKSGFIPKIFGFCLIFGCVCWITDSVLFLLFPAYHQVVSSYIMNVVWIGEIPILLWLLIMGAKNEIITPDKSNDGIISLEQRS